MKVTDYFPLVRQWAHDRDIINESTIAAQFVKLVEESSEIRVDPRDGIGDTMVVAIIVAAQSGIKLEDLKPKVSGLTLLSDLGNLANAISKSKPLEEPLAFIYGHCEFLATHYDEAFSSCINHAWNEIKDRKGKMIKGVYVKEADL